MAIYEVRPVPDDLIPLHLVKDGGYTAGKLGKSEMVEYAGDAVMVENIKSAVRLDLPEFHPGLVRHDGHIAVVGMGTSLKQTVAALRRDQAAGFTVLAVKGAHDWLLDNGVVPTLAVSMDSQSHTWKGMTKPNPACCYLLASKCHPNTFQALQGRHVIRWHAWGGDEINKLYPDGGHLVGGGSTSGLRAITIAYLLGFYKIRLYGFDSCLNGMEMRVDGSPAQQWALPIKAGLDAPFRMCDAALVAQAMEFQDMTFGIMPGVKIEVVGDGLIADIMAERRRLGNNDGWTN